MHGCSAEEQARATEQLPLATEIPPAMDPGCECRSIRREAGTQPAVVHCHEISHEKEWIRQHAHSNPHHKLRVAPDHRCLAEVIIHCIGVDEVSQEVAAPEEDDIPQDVRD